MNAPAVMLNQVSEPQLCYTHFSITNVNATVATQPSLHFIAERGDSSERSFTKKSSSQEFVVNFQGEESGSHSTAFAGSCVTPNHDDTGLLLTCCKMQRLAEALHSST